MLLDTERRLRKLAAQLEQRMTSLPDQHALLRAIGQRMDTLRLGQMRLLTRALGVGRGPGGHP